MRSLRRCPALVAVVLVALAAQMAIAAGHSHSARAYQYTAQIACRTFLPPSAHEPCAPRHQDRDDCPICTTLGLAGSAVLSDAPTLSVPALANESVPPAIRIPFSLQAVAAGFQARGPPAA